MNKELPYVIRIKSRSKFRFIKGLYPRGKKLLKQSYINWVARKNGAIIGKCVTIPYTLAKRANSNLIIGNNSSIQTDLIDLRSKVEIGNNVIIGSAVEIITTSHYVDSTEWEHKYYGIKIEDYVWLASRAFILPSCRLIQKGAVCAAGSVVFKNIEEMSIVTGNPAIHLRFRKKVHSNLVIESLLGNDFYRYCQTYFNKNKNE